MIEREYQSNHPVLKEVLELLSECPDAREFLVAYCDYCHAIDDVIDEKITDSEYINKLHAASLDLYNMPFWLKNAAMLWPLVHLINNDYADSNIWSASPLEWQRHQADVLRHGGNYMIFAVILLTKGREALRKYSAQIREVSYLMHHDKETGKPV